MQLGPEDYYPFRGEGALVGGRGGTAPKNVCAGGYTKGEKKSIFNKMRGNSVQVLRPRPNFACSASVKTSISFCCIQHTD